MYKKSFVSLVFSSNSIQILLLDSTKKSVVKLATVAIPEGVIRGYKVIAVEKLAFVLKSAWKTYGIKEKSVGAIVPEFSTYTKTLELPDLEGSELDEAVRWQTQEFLPDSGRDMIMDWKVLESKIEQNQILSVAIPQEILSGYVQAIGSAGLYPMEVETPSLALVRMAQMDGKIRLVIYSNNGEAVVILAQGEKIIGSLVVNAMSQDAVLNTAVRLVRRFADVKPEKVFIGGTQISKDLVDGIQKFLGLPYEWMRQGIKGLDATAEQQYMLAISLQLKEPSKPSDPATINLLPPAWVKQYEMKYLKLRVWGILIFSTIVIWACLFASVGMLFALNTQERSLSSQSESLSSPSDQIQNQIKQVNEDITRVQSIKEKYVDPAIIVNSITKSVVDSTSIENIQINFETGLIQISGLADQRQSLLELKKSLEENEDFEQVGLPLSAYLGEGQIPFEINMYYSKLAVPKKPAKIKINK